MDEKKLNRRQVKDALISLIEEFRKKTLKPLQNKIKAKVKSITPDKNKDSIQESLDYLRVCVKYTLYDLEATRRELKAALKKLKEYEK